MKVLLVSSSSGSRGGGEFYLLGLGKGLKAQGHEIHLTMSTHPTMDEFAAMCISDGLEVTRIEYTNTYRRRLRTVSAWCDRKTPGRIASVIRDFAPDFVHLNFQSVEDGMDLVKAGELSGLPCAATIHVTRSMSQLGAAGGWIRDSLARRRLSKSKLPLIGISEVSAAGLADFVDGRLTTPEDFSVTDSQPGNSIFTVANGVDHVRDLNRGAVRSEWGLAEDRYVLGCIARLENQKNPSFIVPLLKALPERAHVVWVGDGSLRESLEGSLAAAGLTDRVTLDGWRADATQRMAGFDSFILPSLFEGLPLAILEAMSAGLPCVVSDVDGTRNAVQHGTTGYLCGVNDAKDWATNIRKLMDDPSHAAEMGKQAKARHNAEFSLAAMAKETARVYEAVQSNRASRPANSQE